MALLPGIQIVSFCCCCSFSISFPPPSYLSLCSFASFFVLFCSFLLRCRRNVSFQCGAGVQCCFCSFIEYLWCLLFVQRVLSSVFGTSFIFHFLSLAVFLVLRLWVHIIQCFILIHGRTLTPLLLLSRSVHTAYVIH